jgi:lipopolysaccharide export system protein LptA
MRILPTIFSFGVILSFVFLLPPQINPFSQVNSVRFDRGHYVLCEKRDNIGKSSPSSRRGYSNRANKPSKKMSSESPIIIHSNTLEVDQNLRVIVFKGKVRARTEDMVVDCDKMIVYYLGNPAKKQSNLESNRIEKIVALGDVIINRFDGGVARAGKAVFYQNEGKIVLTENPVVKQGRDFIEGHRIIMFLDENRSIIEGGKTKRVKATIFPKEEKGKK